MTQLSNSTPPLPSIHEYGLMLHNDPRLYRIRAEPTDTTYNHPRCRSPKVIQMCEVIVDLTTRRYVKNRWEVGGTPPDTLIAMFTSVEVSDILMVSW